MTMENGRLPDGPRQPERRRYLAVAQEILHAVTLGNLGTGDRLPHERELARRCGVSRSTVREALLALELSGIIEVRPGAGCFLLGTGHIGSMATLPTDSKPRQLLEVRIQLEPLAARRCAAGIGRDDLARIRRLVEEASRSSADSADSMERYLLVNLAFHREIARSCGNPVLAGVTVQLIDAETHPLWMMVDGIVVRDPAIRAEELDEHRSILNAVAAGDEEAAAEAMAAHLDALAARTFGPGASQPKVTRARPRTVSRRR
jgi:GntR family transcriptional repressor for pyruvate dehydrogenase complex